jgi:hypothetical protein
MLATGEDQGRAEQLAQHWDQLQGGCQDGSQLGQELTDICKVIIYLLYLFIVIFYSPALVIKVY